MSEETILGMIIPPNMPRSGNRLSRWFGRTVYTALGWKLSGAFPNEKKMVLAAAPHTSNWDFVVAMLALMAIGIRVSFLMKKEAFFWPLKSFFLWLGGIPIDRAGGNDTVEQVQSWFSSTEKAWVGITPEGTRNKVEHYKTGFVRIAKAADVPVGFVCWDYPTKTIVLEKGWQLTGDNEKDAKEIQNYLSQKYRGKNPAKQ